MARSKKRRQHQSRFSLENLETRNLLAADLVIADTEFDAADIDQDGAVGPLDAMSMINEMNGVRDSRATAADRGSRFDVNGDGNFTPLDILMVINRFGARRQNDRGGPGNSGQGGSGRGPGHGDPGGGPGDPNGDAQPPLPIREIDGSGNNERNPDWGSAHQELLRVSPTEYADGLSAPAGADRASAREISNLVAAQSESVLNDRGLSDFLWQWGQFLDHDLDATEASDPAEPFNIAVPAGDPLFDPFNTGTQEISLNRSIYEVDANGVRQQINEITAFIDGSNVYGSDDLRAEALRTFEGGQLKTSDGDLLPFNVDGLPNAGGTSDAFFLAGDVRANEQAGLIAMHTLWVREHNRIAEELAQADPQATDEMLYQRARAVVIGQMQAITYNEFLPALLGDRAIDRYRGYDRRVDPSIATEFSTAAYRFGHSMLPTELLRLNNDGSTADEGNLALRDAFFDPSNITDHGIDSLLVGLANQQAQEVDNMVVDDIRNFLFGPPGSGGFDLASLNIQRGRDHGLADYNQMRVAYGLEPVSTFEDISSDPDVQAALQAAYDSVDDIDAWVGGLAEDHVRGASVGELVHTVLVDQFTRLRDGDRFWYQEIFRGQELRRIDRTTLADVIQRNTDVTGLQDNVFFVPDSSAGTIAAFLGTPTGPNDAPVVDTQGQQTVESTIDNQPPQPGAERSNGGRRGDDSRRDREQVADMVFADEAADLI